MTQSVKDTSGMFTSNFSCTSVDLQEKFFYPGTKSSYLTDLPSQRLVKAVGTRNYRRSSFCLRALTMTVKLEPRLF